MKISIIGAGVIGLSCAYYLRKEGHEVTVIDNGDITAGCSFGNMGYVSPSHFIPLATPGIVAKGLKWMLNSSSPFYIKPRLNLDLVRWGITFYRSANTRYLAKNILPLNNLLQLSRLQVNEWKTDMGDSFGLDEKGCWMLYKNEKTGDHEKHLAEQANKLGLKTIICSAAEVQGYEKETEVNIAGGVLYLDDCYVDPAKLMNTLHQRLELNGVKFQLKCQVTGFENKAQKVTAVITGGQKIETDELVIANGSWIPSLAKSLGIRILMQPGKGYSYYYTGLRSNLVYPSILVDDRVATTPYGRSLRIGGTMELSGHSNNILPKRVMSVYNAIEKYYPKLHLPVPDPQKAWYGYRPVTPDGMPYIGRHPRFNNLSFAGGHAMLGVSASMGTGKLISELINGRPTTIEISAFNPARFG
jgi:D-amino-acid dehydrogenase